MPDKAESGLRPVIAAEDVFLRGDDGLLYGPLNLSLQPGEGALVMVNDLGLMRRLMKCCLGFLRPDSGRVDRWLPLGPEAEADQYYDLYRQTGYVDRQSQLLTSLPLLENLVLHHEYAGVPEAVEASRRILDSLGLAGDELVRASDLPEPVRRLALYALAFCGPPRLMLMERPAQFLDRDFNLVWDLILRRASDEGLAYVVFDRARSIYIPEHFTATVSFAPGNI